MYCSILNIKLTQLKALIVEKTVLYFKMKLKRVRFLLHRRIVKMTNLKTLLV